MARYVGTNDGPAKLMQELLVFQDLARVDAVTGEIERWRDDRKRTDVTARWKGYNKDGMGLAEYNGRIYEGKVIASKCKQKDAIVNLRRTRLMNFIDWQ